MLNTCVLKALKYVPAIKAFRELETRLDGPKEAGTDRAPLTFAFLLATLTKSPLSFQNSPSIWKIVKVPSLKYYCFDT